MRRTISRESVLLPVLLAVCSITATLIVGEVALRAIDFEFHLYPEAIEFGNPTRARIERAFLVDRDLFWVPKDYFQRLDEARRKGVAVVFMGDSCTQFGRYPERFVELVASRFGGVEPSMVSLGVGGWSTHQGLKQLRRDIVSLEPNVITIYFGWNDHWIGFGVEDRQVTWINDSPIFGILQTTRLAQLLAKGYVAATRPGDREPPLRVPLRDFKANLRQMAQIATAHGIVPVFLTAPTSHERGREPKHLERRHIANLENLVPLHQKYVAAVRDVALLEDVVLCDLARDFETVPTDLLRNRYFFKRGVHLTPAGDAMLARVLFRCFQRNDLLESTLAPSTGGRTDTP